MRKTDDNQILQMLREGKTQAEMARIVGVSAVAIHKRLKRIIPKPESLDKLTQKEQKFALAIAEGKSRISACMEAFDVSTRESAKALQNALMQKDDIKIAIRDLMQIYGLTRGYRIHKLKALVDHVDPVIQLKALDTSFKLDGLYNEKDTPNEIKIRIVVVDHPSVSPATIDITPSPELTSENDESIGRGESEA